MNETSDRWDRVIAFLKTGKGLALLGAEFAFVILWDNSTLTIPPKVGPLVLAACYRIAVGAAVTPQRQLAWPITRHGRAGLG